MPFRVSDEQVEIFWREGYCIFKCLLSAGLLADLRRSAEQARQITHEIRGPDAQRLQPIWDYRERLNFKPFEELYELEELRSAIHRVLSPLHTLGKPDRMGILFEPSVAPWTTHWHRDARDLSDPEKLADWEATQADINCWNQLNCPFYEDTCTWVVPGSQSRPDLDRETDWLKRASLPDPRSAPKTPEEKELRSYDAVHSMPGAMRVMLDAGDLLLYRNTLWHLGAYTPYKRRATLHDNPFTPTSVDRVYPPQSAPARESASPVLTASP